MADGRHLENRYDVITPMRTVRFGRNLANRCRIMMQNCKPKAEVEFQHDGGSFPENRSGYKSAVD